MSKEIKEVNNVIKKHYIEVNIPGQEKQTLIKHLFKLVKASTKTKFGNCWIEKHQQKDTYRIILMDNLLSLQRAKLFKIFAEDVENLYKRYCEYKEMRKLFETYNSKIKPVCQCESCTKMNGAYSNED